MTKLLNSFLPHTIIPYINLVCIINLHLHTYAYTHTETQFDWHESTLCHIREILSIISQYKILTIQSHDFHLSYRFLLRVLKRNSLSAS